MDSVFIVMDFIEHDLKILSEDMQEPFLQSEVKTLMMQLVSATALMHSQWIVHRDLKTSNLLMNNRGQIKVADFGLARYLGEPTPPLTQLVVTLWYRSPELLLGAKEYGTEVDMWSIGCIFGELLLKEPLLQGKNEVDQLSKVCSVNCVFFFFFLSFFSLLFSAVACTNFLLLLLKIFELCGIPTEENWPGFRKLPNAKALNFPRNRLTYNSLPPLSQSSSQS